MQASEAYAEGRPLIKARPVIYRGPAGFRSNCPIHRRTAITRELHLPVEVFISFELCRADAEDRDKTGPVKKPAPNSEGIFQGDSQPSEIVDPVLQ